MQIISKQDLIYSFDKNHPPVAKVRSGESLVFETCDCFDDAISREDQLVTEIDFERINPATGPVFVEGAQPGDLLKVHIKSIKLNDQGVLAVAPGFGLIGDHVSTPATRVLAIEEESAEFLGQKLPLKKMIGVIGVAPAGEAVATGNPGDHGGNMDSLTIGEGVSLYLPVEVEGALFALGDLHASMGDGEIGVSGVEIAGQVEVQVEVLKDCHLPTPFVQTENHYISIASDADWKKAAQKASVNMRNFISQNTKLNENDALMLLSAAGNLRVNQVVNPNVSFRMEISKDLVDFYR